jgi:mono/diheme cytochrome c family protein
VKCHRENGEGGELDIEGTKIKVPSYQKESVKKGSDLEYVEQIEKGGDGMPKFKGKISDQEIKDLVKLIRRDFQK